MTTDEMERQIFQLQRQVKDLAEIVQTLRARGGREVAIGSMISDGENAGSLRDVFCFGGEPGSDPTYEGQLCIKRDAWMCDEQGRAARINMMYADYYGNLDIPLFVAGWSW